nr:histidine kinase dimerization/phospho-acceptor domain-containing protein [Duganella violaceicalia]
MREIGAAFNAMLDRLEDGVQRLSGFAADLLAHDMRTPVNTLMVETQVALSRQRTAEEYHVLLASNSEEYERLARMIENTLFLARVDNAQQALRRESTVDPRDEDARWSGARLHRPERRYCKETRARYSRACQARYAGLAGVAAHPSRPFQGR